MATIVLLHGSFHAAWNWHKTVPLLAAAGHRALAIDLPGHGRDRTPPGRVTLRRCADQVVDLVDNLDSNVVLLAHSRNGIVISEAAERIPDKLDGLIYLAAYLVPAGKSMMDFAVLDRESLVVQNVATGLEPKYAPAVLRTFRHPGARWMARKLLPCNRQTHRLNPKAYREALYHDCPPEITELANVLLEPEPNWPGFTPLNLTPDRYGRVPKVYIECLQDRAVTLQLQRKMVAESPCNAVLSLDSSHSPFFSQPDELAAKIEQALGVFKNTVRTPNYR